MPYSAAPLERWARRERVSKLRDLLMEYEAGRPLSGEPLALLMDALRHVLRDGKSFEVSLGLSPPRGGKTMTISALHAELEDDGRRWGTLVVHGEPGPVQRSRKAKTSVHRVAWPK